DQYYNEVGYSASSSNHPELVEFYATYTGEYYIKVEPYDIPLAPYYTISTRVFLNQPPSIDQLEHNPENPLNTEQIGITCIVIDDSGVESVILSYNSSVGWVNVTMNCVGDNSYQAIIPSQIDATCIEYVIYAEDAYGLSTVSIKQTILIYEEPIISEFNSSLFMLFMIPAITIVSLLLFKKRKIQ
ncbi:MAG: hypothetical protein ACTSPO_14940, partial [Candidatus Heimdallarchaeaceae archaeon]